MEKLLISNPYKFPFQQAAILSMTYACWCVCVSFVHVCGMSDALSSSQRTFWVIPVCWLYWSLAGRPLRAALRRLQRQTRAPPSLPSCPGDNDVKAAHDDNESKTRDFCSLCVNFCKYELVYFHITGYDVLLSFSHIWIMQIFITCTCLKSQAFPLCSCMNTLQQTRTGEDAIFVLTYILLSYPFKSATTKMHDGGGDADTEGKGNKKRKTRPWESFSAALSKSAAPQAVEQLLATAASETPQHHHTDRDSQPAESGCTWSTVSLLHIILLSGLLTTEWHVNSLQGQLNYDLKNNKLSLRQVKQDSSRTKVKSVTQENAHCSLRHNWNKPPVKTKSLFILIYRHLLWADEMEKERKHLCHFLNVAEKFQFWLFVLECLDLFQHS